MEGRSVRLTWVPVNTFSSFAVWKNIFCNLYKRILQSEQIHFIVYKVSRELGRVGRSDCTIGSLSVTHKSSATAAINLNRGHNLYIYSNWYRYMYILYILKNHTHIENNSMDNRPHWNCELIIWSNLLTNIYSSVWWSLQSSTPPSYAMSLMALILW